MEHFTVKIVYLRDLVNASATMATIRVFLAPMCFNRMHGTRSRATMSAAAVTLMQRAASALVRPRSISRKGNTMEKLMLDTLKAASPATMLTNVESLNSHRCHVFANLPIQVASKINTKKYGNF